MQQKKKIKVAILQISERLFKHSEKLLWLHTRLQTSYSVFFKIVLNATLL